MFENKTLESYYVLFGTAVQRLNASLSGVEGIMARVGGYSGQDTPHQPGNA